VNVYTIEGAVAAIPFSEIEEPLFELIAGSVQAGKMGPRVYAHEG
jgi:hypothetical protein